LIIIDIIFVYFKLNKGRQFGLKTGCVMGPGLKTEGRGF